MHQTTTFPTPATTFPHQRPPSCSSSYHSYTRDHLPATSTTFLYQQLPLLHQRPPSCTNYQFLDFTNWRPPYHIPITIHHNKIWSFETTTLFCHSYLVRFQSLILQRFVGSIYLSASQQSHFRIRINLVLQKSFFSDITLMQKGISSLLTAK